MIDLPLNFEMMESKITYKKLLLGNSK